MSASLTIIGGLVHLSGNPIQIVVDGSIQRDNLRLALKITCPQLLGSPFIEEIAPDAFLCSKFDVSGFFDQPVDYEFDFPPVGVITDHRVLEFNATLDAGEVYTDANGDRQEAWMNLAENNSIRVLKGKLRAHELALLNETGLSFATEYIDTGKFLTHLPNEMHVLPGQIVKLWFLSRWNDILNARWKCRTWLNHEANQITLSENMVLDPVSGLIEFNVNPVFMGINDEFAGDTDFGLYMREYEFWLEDAATGNPISEIRKFIVDNEPHESIFTMFYVNPLSGIDSIILTGEYTEGLQLENETALVPVPFGSGTKIAGLKTVASSGQRKWTINTGYKQRKDILMLRDFLEAKERWMIDPDNAETLIPILVESDDYLLFDSTPGEIPNLNIKVFEAHK